MRSLVHVRADQPTGYRMIILARLAILSVFMAACQSERPVDETLAAKERAPADVPAANMSRGEAPVGDGAAPAQVSASAPPRATVHRHRLRLDVSNATVEISPGVKFAAWTFATAKEFVLVQSEFYLTSDSAGRTRSLAWERLLSLAPDCVVFNGRAAQYATHPIDVHANELIRLYMVNAGPNRVSSFHVVGGIFERVFADGWVKPTYDGVQTVAVPVGGGAMFEIRLKEPGDYPFVTHAFADATKGAIGILRAQARGT